MENELKAYMKLKTYIDVYSEIINTRMITNKSEEDIFIIMLEEAFDNRDKTLEQVCFDIREKILSGEYNV